MHYSFVVPVTGCVVWVWLGQHCFGLCFIWLCLLRAAKLAALWHCYDVDTPSVAQWSLVCKVFTAPNWLIPKLCQIRTTPIMVTNIQKPRNLSCKISMSMMVCTVLILQKRLLSFSMTPELFVVKAISGFINCFLVIAMCSSHFQKQMLIWRSPVILNYFIYLFIFLLFKEVFIKVYR